MEQKILFLFYFGKKEHCIELTDHLENSRGRVKFQNVIQQQQSGAVEACWAHNPEVRGSKPRSASNSFTTRMSEDI